MPAPAISPDCTTSYRRPRRHRLPRPVLIRKAVGFIRPASPHPRSAWSRAEPEMQRHEVALGEHLVQPHQLDTVFRPELHHGVRLVGDHSHVEATARAAGVLCGRTGTSDVVDASVGSCCVLGSATTMSSRRTRGMSCARCPVARDRRLSGAQSQPASAPATSLCGRQAGWLGCSAGASALVGSLLPARWRCRGLRCRSRTGRCARSGRARSGLGPLQ